MTEPTNDNVYPTVRITERRTNGDCGIVAIAQLIGMSYEDALEAMVAVAGGAHNKGVYVTQIIEAAARIGHTLKRKRKFDPEETTGILLLTCSKNRMDKEHVALLRWGLVFDHQKEGQGEVWEYEDFMSHFGAKVRGILIKL